MGVIRYADEPGRSAEICICEIFGRHVNSNHATVGVGRHPLGDPRKALIALGTRATA